MDGEEPVAADPRETADVGEDGRAAGLLRGRASRLAGGTADQPDRYTRREQCSPGRPNLLAMDQAGLRASRSVSGAWVVAWRSTRRFRLTRFTTRSSSNSWIRSFASSGFIRPSRTQDS